MDGMIMFAHFRKKYRVRSIFSEHELSDHSIKELPKMYIFSGKFKKREPVYESTIS
jgi:hypothetical protein